MSGDQGHAGSGGRRALSAAVPGGGTLATLTVPHAPTSAGEVRHSLVGDLRRLGLTRDQVDDAALLVSELVGNAVRYARPLAGGVIRVSWLCDHNRLVVRVTDGGGLDAPHLRQAGPADTRGRGLAIVDALAYAWGVDNHSDTSTVWVELLRR
ncbi:MAG TPA: ATP-binding protein [Mycobacteriales bacterium]|nr:ATP-binding protein [Mycobacteriales bacterium]